MLQHPTTRTLATRRRVMSKPSDTFCRLFTPALCNRELSGRRAEAILDWHRLFGVPACKI